MNGPTKAVGPPLTPLPARKTMGVSCGMLRDKIETLLTQADSLEIYRTRDFVKQSSRAWRSSRV
jgi:hypothetical protein